MPASIHRNRVEAQLSHIRVARTFQCVHAGASQVRAELLKQTGQCQDFRPHLLWQLVEFRLELVTDLDIPHH